MSAEIIDLKQAKKARVFRRLKARLSSGHTICLEDPAAFAVTFACGLRRYHAWQRRYLEMLASESQCSPPR